MNLFVVEDEYTYYLCLYILGYEPFCRGRWIHILFTFIYLRFCILFAMEDEYTYYLCLYILGHDPFCCGRWIHILFTFIYLRSWNFLLWKMNTHTIYVYISKLMNLFVVEDEYTLFTFIYIRSWTFLLWKMNAHIIYVYIS